MRAHRLPFRLGVGALCLGAASTSAQRSSLPPIRPLGAVVARAKVEIADVQAVRVLSDGRVLVNSPASRRLLLLDSTLATARAIVAASGNSAPEYAAPNGVLVAARGDSSFLIIGASKIDVIDPAGNVVRSLAIPARDAAAGEVAAGDREGRVLHIPPAPFFLLFVPREFVGDTIITGPEVVPLLRYDPATGRTDTVATIHGPRRRQAITRWENGGRGVSAQDPFPLIGDDWTVLSDGTIAIARLQGYSLEWISPSGVQVAGPSVAHTWVAISAAGKQRIVDSMRVVHNAAHADSLFPIDSARYDSLALVAKANPEAITDSAGKRLSLGPRPVRLQFVAPTDLPDSMPPFAPAGMVADSEDNLWIQNYSPARTGGGIVYDVVNRKGALVDRVELPPGASLLAFTPGFAFLRMTAGNGVTIEKARIR
jgi:hypothetical protein